MHDPSLTSAIFPTVSDPMKSQLEFIITQEMVDAFVALTSDRSSLHTQTAFARRSIYRTKLVHGMLPVVFLAGLDIFQKQNSSLTLTQLTLKFLKPIFIGDCLQLIAIEKKLDGPGAQTQCDFEIIKKDSDLVLTKGYFIVQEDGSDEGTPVAQLQHVAPSAGMIIEELKEESFLYEQIQKGEQRGFSFVISQTVFETLHRILQCGQINMQLSDIRTQQRLSPLLAATLSSTMAGICLPGKFATFIDLTLQFQGPLNLGQRYYLKGQVGFKSDKMRVIVNDISIVADDHPETNLANGKMTVKVNTPPPDMPNIESLREFVGEQSLKNKVVLITGASRGIGATTAKLFALHGAKVAVNFYQGQEDAQAVVDQILSVQAQGIAVKADVSDLTQVKQMVAMICSQFGTIDILINNAVRDARPIPFAELSWSDIQNEIDVTVKGAMQCCQEVLPLMIKQGSGKIINMGTVFTDNPVPHQAKYILTKSALLGLTRSLAVEFAPLNIQVNMVSPSVVETDLSQGAGDMFSKTDRSFPMGRKAQPIDVAKTIVTLASGQLPFTTGQKIMVTGGQAPFL